MTAISFSMFKQKLVSRTKKQTIRRLNIPWLESMEKNGIQIYWKQRTKQSEKLYDAVFTEVRFYMFGRSGLRWEVIPEPDWRDPNAFVDPPLRELSQSEKEEIARKDGFNNVDELNQMFLKMYGTAIFKPDVFDMQPVFMCIHWEWVDA